MIAPRNLKDAPGVWIGAFFYVLNPSPIHSECDVIFGFTRDRAGMAADALAVVNDESVFHIWNFSSSRDRPS